MSWLYATAGLRDGARPSHEISVCTRHRDPAGSFARGRQQQQGGHPTAAPSSLFLWGPRPCPTWAQCSLYKVRIQALSYPRRTFRADRPLRVSRQRKLRCRVLSKLHAELSAPSMHQVTYFGLRPNMHEPFRRRQSNSGSGSFPHLCSARALDVSFAGMHGNACTEPDPCKLEPAGPSSSHSW